MGIASSRIDENELLNEYEKLNVTYLNLYKTYEHVKAQEDVLRSENKDLQKQIKRLVDRKNVDNYLSGHDNSILEDTFEKEYILKYHTYLTNLIRRGDVSV